MTTFDLDDFDDEIPTDPSFRAQRPRVLLVEDDEAMRELIASRMRREAFEVVEAGSGFEALELLGTTDADPVDLLVMDVHIPGSSGLEIARYLRKARWTTPVVLITAFPDAALIAEAAALDLALLAKPFPLDVLSDAAIAALVAATVSPLERAT